VGHAFNPWTRMVQPSGTGLRPCQYAAHERLQGAAQAKPCLLQHETAENRLGIAAYGPLAGFYNTGSTHLQ